jgi:DNA-binding transcriptional regulator YiaG
LKSKETYIRQRAAEKLRTIAVMKEFRRMRLNTDLSATRLAAELKVKVLTLWRWENGNAVPPSWETIRPRWKAALDRAKRNPKASKKVAISN